MVTTATICRLKNVSKRLLKTRYTDLTPPEKRYIKLLEKEHRLQIELNIFWRGVNRDEHGRASQNNDWDFYHYAEAELTKVIAQIDRLLAKNGWDDSEVKEIQSRHTQTNRSPGGSF